MRLRYHSLLKTTIYFIYHSRNLIAYLCKYIHYKLSYNSNYLITYNYKNNKIVRKKLENYKSEDTLSIVKTKTDNVVLYHRIFSNAHENNFKTPVISNHNILSIVIKIDNKEYDFDINLFSVVNNKILDKAFVYWYIKYKYNTDCNDNYAVNIIDNNINTFIIDKRHYILLEKDSFLVKTI